MESGRMGCVCVRILVMVEEEDEAYFWVVMLETSQSKQSRERQVRLEDRVKAG